MANFGFLDLGNEITDPLDTANGREAAMGAEFDGTPETLAGNDYGLYTVQHDNTNVNGLTGGLSIGDDWSDARQLRINVIGSGYFNPNSSNYGGGDSSNNTVNTLPANTSFKSYGADATVYIAIFHDDDNWALYEATEEYFTPHANQSVNIADVWNIVSTIESRGTVQDSSPSWITFSTDYDAAYADGGLPNYSDGVTHLDQISGNNGSGNYVSLTGGVVAVNESTDNQFIFNYTSTEIAAANDLWWDGDKSWRYKRMLVVADSSGNNKGFGYIGAHLGENSSGDEEFSMDVIRDKAGEVCYFINLKGESIDSSLATTDLLYMSGSLKDLPDVHDTNSEIVGNATDLTGTVPFEWTHPFGKAPASTATNYYAVSDINWDTDNDLQGTAATRTTATEIIASGTTEINVASVSAFPSRGFFEVTTENGIEAYHYHRDSANNRFTSLTYLGLVTGRTVSNNVVTDWGTLRYQGRASGTQGAIAVTANDNNIFELRAELPFIEDYVGDEIATTSVNVADDSEYPVYDLDASGKNRLGLTGVLDFGPKGKSNIGDEIHRHALVVHTEDLIIDIYKGAHRDDTDTDEGYFKPSAGFMSFTRILDYQNNVNAESCNFAMSQSKDSFINPRGFESTNNITWISSGDCSSNQSTARFPGGSGSNFDAQKDWHGCLIFGGRAESDILLGNDGGVEATNNDNYIVRGVFSSVTNNNSINIRWPSIQEENTIYQPSGGFAGSHTGALSATGSDLGYSSIAGRYELGAAGVDYTNVELFYGGTLNTNEHPSNFFWRANGTTKQYLEVTNVNSVDRRARRGASSWADANNSYHPSWNCSWTYAGEWKNLEENTKIYSSYAVDNTDNDDDIWAGAFDDPPTITVTDEGTAAIKFVDTIYEGKTQSWGSQVLFDGDTGFRGFQEIGTATANSAFAESVRAEGNTNPVDEPWEYSIKKYLKKDMHIALGPVQKPVGGVLVETIEISPYEKVSLSGGVSADGLLQEDEPNLDTSLLISSQFTELLSEDNVAKLVRGTSNGTLSGTVNALNAAGHPNVTRTVSAGDASFTISTQVINAGNSATATLDTLYAMIAYSTAVPYSDTEGRRHFINPATTVDANGIWDLTTSTNDDITGIEIIRTDSNGEGAFEIGSNIKGIKFDPTVFQLKLSDYNIKDGIIIDSDQAYNNSTASFSPNNFPHTNHVFGAFHMYGRYTDTTVSATERTIEFDPAEEDNINFYDGSTPNFRWEFARPVKIKGLTKAANIQSGTGKWIDSSHADGVKFVKDVTVNLKRPAGDTSTLPLANNNFYNCEVWEIDTEDENDTWTQLVGRTEEAAAVTNDGNDGTIEFEATAGKTQYWAISIDGYKIASGVVAEDEVETTYTLEDEVHAEIYEATNFTTDEQTFFAEGLKDYDSSDADGVANYASIVSEELHFQVKASTLTASIDMSEENAKTWLRWSVMHSHKYLVLLAQQQIANDLFEINAQHITVKTGERPQLTHGTTSDGLIHDFLMDIEIYDRDTEEDLYRKITSSVKSSQILFKARSTGVNDGDVRSIVNEILDARKMKQSLYDSVVNVGLGIPAVTEDSTDDNKSLNTTPNV